MDGGRHHRQTKFLVDTSWSASFVSLGNWQVSETYPQARSIISEGGYSSVVQISRDKLGADLTARFQQLSTNCTFSKHVKALVEQTKGQKNLITNRINHRIYVRCMEFNQGSLPLISRAITELVWPIALRVSMPDIAGLTCNKVNLDHDSYYRELSPTTFKLFFQLIRSTRDNVLEPFCHTFHLKL
ncbi:hypothetical protein ASPBRDRAFT_62329 [Aspergillus brasiliensis CBS 101740]|uniref:Uncharacterized protein n=1 Tax=Aspergillus brasiliensis (strain CBS 101740 / IMI 381727 / IBT 21946) TaxID=767769 RepID=A0A1L9UWS7_ASPBC|nr:hypothetical protein ASPBRDRAFT_62329 [Aspergillus brasiliensis CBS 101740]